MKKEKEFVQVVECYPFGSSLKEKGHVLQQLQKKVRKHNAKLTYFDNHIMAEYFVHKRDQLLFY